jgi:fatty acid desaturase
MGPVNPAQLNPLTTASDVVGASHVPSRPPLTRVTSNLDIPTLRIAFAVYAGYFVLTWFFRDLPLWIAAPLGAVWLAWHGSLQHETIHGHPTSSRRLNSAIASAPLSLWIPYRIYRSTHLKHHRHGGRYLTEVSGDPESFFLRPGTLSRSGTLLRLVYLGNCTLVGRLLLGPALTVFRFWSAEARKAVVGHRGCRAIWARHAIGVALVLSWTSGVCHIPVSVYVMLFVYPGMSLSHLRSFVEHRSDPEPSFRTRAVEAHPVLALIFLNNNLHIAHHAHPTLPWHQLPRVWNQMRDSATGSGLVFSEGYREVVENYLFRPVIGVEHPGKDRG